MSGKVAISGFALLMIVFCIAYRLFWKNRIDNWMSTTGNGLKSTSKSYSDDNYTVTTEFTYTVNATEMKKRVGGNHKYKIDQQIPILYDPNNPSRVVIYEPKTLKLFGTYVPLVCTVFLVLAQIGIFDDL